MPLTLPTGFDDELVKDTIYPLLLFEITLTDDTVLRYSSQAVTFDSNSYTQLAVEMSPIVEEMSTRIPDTEVVFSNVDSTFRSYVEPIDKFSRGLLVIRLGLRDADGTWLNAAGSDLSIVLFKGRIERSRRINEVAFGVPAVGIGKGALSTLPRRRQAIWCNAKFADLEDCFYSETTKASSTESSTNQVGCVDAITNKIDVDDQIAVGNNTGLTVSAILEAQLIQVDSVISYNLSDSVAHEVCNREFADCRKRDRTHEYMGFRGGDSIEIFNPPDPRLAAGTPTGRYAFPAEGLSIYNDVERNPYGEPLGQEDLPVPLVYGRRTVEGNLIETSLFQQTTPRYNPKSGWYNVTSDFSTRFYSISEGEIGGINGFVADGIIEEDEFKNDGVFKTFGMYYRVGTLGVNDTEGLGDYENDTSTQRTQNSDFMSLTGSAYSRTAYAIIIQPYNEEDYEEITDFQFDVAGIKIQEYLAGGAPDGNATSSRNPIWQVIDFMLHSRYGTGVNITATDINFTTAKTYADYCNVTFEGPVTTVNDTGSILGPSFPMYRVSDATEFERGMEVLYNGTSYTDDPDYIQHIIWPVNLVLTKQRTNFTVGDEIKAILPRYQSDVLIDRQREMSSHLEIILGSCLGFMTYDEQGRIEIKVEKDEAASAGHFKDFGASQGYGIVEDTFEWLPDPRGEERLNRIHVRYVKQNGQEAEAVASDWDDIDSHELRIGEVDIPSASSRDNAQRIADILLAKEQSFTTGAVFTVGPIGLKLQPGDVIEVTHAVPNWSGAFKRVQKVERMGLGSDEELLVRLTVIDYDQNIYSVSRPPARYYDTVEPTVTLSVTADSAGRIILTWTGGLVSRHSHYNIYKSESTFGGSVVPSQRIATQWGPRIGRAGTRPGGFYTGGTYQRGAGSYTYIPTDDEIGETLYFVVASVQYRGRYTGPILSNEVSVAVMPDPADTEQATPFNLVFDGDFQDELNWFLTAPTGAETEHDPTGDNGSWTNGSYAYDNDTSTAANGSIANASIEHIWSFNDTSAYDGRAGVNAVAVWAQTFGQGGMDLYYSTDAGVQFTYASGWELGIQSTQFTPVLSISDLSDFQIKVRLHASLFGGTANSSVFEIDFWEQTQVPPYAQINANMLSLYGTNETAAEASRPFPGLNPDTSIVFANQGDEFVTTVMAREFADINNTVHVFLRSGVTNATYSLLEIPVDELSQDWQIWADNWTAPTDLVGPYDVVMSSKNTTRVDGDRLGVFRGSQIPDWMPSVDELRSSYVGDRSTGRPTGFPRGSWARRGRRRSSVTGESK
jgi:hypothetical protein